MISLPEITDEAPPRDRPWRRAALLHCGRSGDLIRVYSHVRTGILRHELARPHLVSSHWRLFDAGPDAFVGLES